MKYTFHFREVTEVREVPRKSAPRNSLESAEYIKVITGLLNAKDFRDRINGIKQLLSDGIITQEIYDKVTHKNAIKLLGL